MSGSLEFSIIIPTYNRLEFTKQALASVEMQRDIDYEIIVVDDGSTDGTMNYLLSLGARIKVLSQANKGPGSARNLGVQHAVGTYVAFLDSDDLWFPWTLATFREVIRRHRSPSLISASTLEFQGETPDVKRESFSAKQFIDYFDTATDPAYVGSGAMVVKRTIFARAGGFDETMPVGEDFDFYFRVGTSRDFSRVLSPVTLAYRRHTGNVSTALPVLYPAAMELLMREAGGRYPGGKVRARERRELLGRMVRPVALSCLRAARGDEAWRLYRQSFLMNARLGRIRFLAGFLIYGMFSLRAARKSIGLNNTPGCDK